MRLTVQNKKKISINNKHISRFCIKWYNVWNSYCHYQMNFKGIVPYMNFVYMWTFLVVFGRHSFEWTISADTYKLNLWNTMSKKIVCKGVTYMYMNADQTQVIGLMQIFANNHLHTSFAIANVILSGCLYPRYSIYIIIHMIILIFLIWEIMY